MLRSEHYSGWRAVTAPFERLRTMMMADMSNKSLLGTARKMWASGGFFGLWRGNLVSVVKVVPQSAIQYAVGGQLIMPAVIGHPTCHQEGTARP